MIEVRLPTILRNHANGLKTASVQGATVGKALSDLVEQYPAMSSQLFDADGSLRKFVNVYLDDEDIRYLSKLDTPVGDGAVISILPAVAGGATSGAPT